MQLVLSNNRIIAHGENFLAMGGVVINTETGARYENATIAECDGCPSDIDKVGYEYHAGVFVPCAPFAGNGNNNGFFMEVCESCATPRSSGIPIKKLSWNKIASVSENISASGGNNEIILEFPVDKSILLNYTRFRYVLKAGATLRMSGVCGLTSDYFNFRLWVNNGTGTGVTCHHYDTGEYSDREYILEKDIIMPFEATLLKYNTYWQATQYGESQKFTLTGPNIPQLYRGYKITAAGDGKTEISYTVDLEGFE